MKRQTVIGAALLLGLISTLGLANAAGTEVGSTPFAPAVTVSVAACKYKIDGPGNCLSPAFYRCQRAWARCAKACNSASSCRARCDDKYAPRCGD